MTGRGPCGAVDRRSPRLCWRGALALVALWLLASCDGVDLHRDHQGAAGDGGVGAACSADPGCEAELICIDQLPGGFCSRLCADVPCPDQTLCVLAQLPGGGEAALCSPVCDETAGCRQGYRCVSVGTRSVCSP